MSVPEVLAKRKELVEMSKQHVNGRDVCDMTDELMRRAHSFRIADTHCHIYPDKIAVKAADAVGDFYGLPMEFGSGDAQTLVNSGSRIGVAKYVVCSVATTPKQVSSINKFIAQKCETHPEFVGLGAWHQGIEDVDALLDEVQALGLHGIKVHPDFQKVDIEDQALMRLYAAMQERELVLLIHVGDDRYSYSAPAKMARVLEKFDKLKVDAAHFGGWMQWDEAERCLAGSQAYYDLSSSLAIIGPERGAQLVETYGADKIMFGVDFPMWNHVAEFKRVLDLGLDDQALQGIFYGNFATLYGVDD